MSESLIVTLRLAFWTAVILLAVGTPLAWLLARRRFFGQEALETLLLLPLVLPPTVLGFYILLLVGESGPLARYLGLHWAFTFKGILLGSVIFNLPLALSAYREAFRSLDEELLQTAYTLGAGPGRVWREVILPLSLPGLLSGTLLAFAHSLGEFGVVIMIGGSLPGETRVVSIYLFELTQALHLQEANRVALLLVILSFVLLLSVRFLEARWRSVTRFTIPFPSR
ncbi:MULTISPECIES: molybdate ABC transporter permease subunit [unclassified Meiothermus]|uniref:molybdate ABC transporter permease subunit n=1 Tax=unclassified Meiothermus TaxID=370471 RepID=UPI000D7BD7A5|nr:MULTISPECIES: molybdate ABC transporter permease subunit [unclassified Meiothermus]PZA06465.1 molybdate ABC transporter permease subunit [Meiothermus sp. Pnk-1]RYM36268.1 molybdate ABC transporter permease subunit [Meiothermus sp. PNK-Is4]